MSLQKLHQILNKSATRLFISAVKDTRNFPICRMDSRTFLLTNYPTIALNQARSCTTSHLISTPSASQQQWDQRTFLSARACTCARLSLNLWLCWSPNLFLIQIFVQNKGTYCTSTVSESTIWEPCPINKGEKIYILLAFNNYSSHDAWSCANGEDSWNML